MKRPDQGVGAMPKGGDYMQPQAISLQLLQ